MYVFLVRSATLTYFEKAQSNMSAVRYIFHRQETVQSRT